jgi:hypothetical protein
VTPLLSISCELCQPELAETRSDHQSPARLQRGQAHSFPEPRYQKAATRVRTSAPFRFALSSGPSPVELGINPEQTDAPLNATRSLSSRVSPDGLRLAEPV